MHQQQQQQSCCSLVSAPNAELCRCPCRHQRHETMPSHEPQPTTSCVSPPLAGVLPGCLPVLQFYPELVPVPFDEFVKGTERSDLWRVLVLHKVSAQRIAWRV